MATAAKLKVEALLRIPADVDAVAPIVIDRAAAAAAPVPRREPHIISWR